MISHFLDLITAVFIVIIDFSLHNKYVLMYKHVHVYKCVPCVLATDLYTFDADITSAEATFSEVCGSYKRIFTRLDLPFVQGVVIL